MPEPGNEPTRDADVARLTAGVIASQGERTQSSLKVGRMTPKERKALVVEKRISRLPWAKPTTDTEIAKAQTAMKRGADHRTARGQISLHGTVEEPKL